MAGSNRIVGGGLLLLAIGYLWVSILSTATPYVEIVATMVVVGTGMGLVSAPATEAIMGAVGEDHAGIGSAVNDATRELGGTFGAAVLGSVFASVYNHRIDSYRGQLPAELPPGRQSRSRRRHQRARSCCRVDLP